MRRLIAVAILPSLVLLAGLAVLAPIHLGWQAQQRWRQETKQLLAEAAAAPQLRDALQRQIEAVRASQLHSRLYPTGGTMGAPALLQGDIDALMSSVQASNRTLAPIPVSDEAFLQRYGVHVTASLRINQLQDVLNRLSQHQRLLRVEQLTVVAPQMQMADENPPLAVSMDIHGYALASAAPRGDAP